MELTTVWFILIAVLWIGYFTLEASTSGSACCCRCWPATTPSVGS